jgi:hypothetical protein
MTRALQLVTLLLALQGCSEPLQAGTVAARDDSTFTVFVLPVLLRDCGFQACHGSQERFFRVFGPGRTRYSPDTEALAELTGHERDYSYQLTRGMIDQADPARSVLLRKPLAVEAGGSGHEGVDKYGRNVYRTPDDEGYLAIAQWVFSEPAAAAGAAAPPIAGAPAAVTP